MVIDILFKDFLKTQTPKLVKLVKKKRGGVGVWSCLPLLNE